MVREERDVQQETLRHELQGLLRQDVQAMVKHEMQFVGATSQPLPHSSPIQISQSLPSRFQPALTLWSKAPGSSSSSSVVAQQRTTDRKRGELASTNHT